MYYGGGQGGVHTERSASCSPILGMMLYEFGSGEWIKCAPPSAQSSGGEKKAQPISPYIYFFNF